MDTLQPAVSIYGYLLVFFLGLTAGLLWTDIRRWTTTSRGGRPAKTIVSDPGVGTRDTRSGRANPWRGRGPGPRRVNIWNTTGPLIFSGTLDALGGYVYSGDGIGLSLDPERAGGALPEVAVLVMRRGATTADPPDSIEAMADAPPFDPVRDDPTCAGCRHSAYWHLRREADASSTLDPRFPCTSPECSCGDFVQGGRLRR